MDALRRFLLGLFGITVGMVVTITVMIKGWGVQPKSWWWIIGVYLVGHVVAQLIVKAATSDD